jgi:hypothetical protein
VEIRGSEVTDTEQRRREPVAKQIFGREELDKYGDVSVTDVLKRLPGVTLSGGNPRLRGLGAGYTLILVNGEPAPPGFSLENLPPSQVERIEVTKGPTAEHSEQAVAPQRENHARPSSEGHAPHAPIAEAAPNVPGGHAVQEAKSPTPERTMFAAQQQRVLLASETPPGGQARQLSEAPDVPAAGK